MNRHSIKMPLLVCGVALILCCSVSKVQAGEYYVATTGNDSYIGSFEYPWRTIQKAFDTAVAGDTVYIRQGTYYKSNSYGLEVKNSGTAGNYITFKAYPGESVVIDGQSSGNQWNGLITIEGKSYIRIEDIVVQNSGDSRWGIYVWAPKPAEASYIELRNVTVTNTGAESIEITGNSSYIIVENCEVSGGYNLGIDIYMKSSLIGRPHHVTVNGCTAYNFYEGVGAAIGSEQADNLVITNNTTYNSNLGIDIGSGKNNTITNNHVYNCKTGIALSSNSDSEVAYNHVHHISPDEGLYSYYWDAHEEEHARNRWYHNIVHDIAGRAVSEQSRKHSGRVDGPLPGHTYSDHEFSHNLFYNLGSWSYQFLFRGTIGVKFYNNTIYMNSSSGAVIYLQDSSVRGAEAHIRNNIISVSGSFTPLLVDSLSSADADYNCYHNRIGSITGPGAHSLFEDPRFVDPANADFHLQSSSPCIDKGDDVGLPFQGSAPDIGCYETEIPRAYMLWAK